MKGLIILMLVLLSSLVSALDPLTVEINRLSDSNIPGDIAEFDIILTNNMESTTTFLLKADAFSVAPFSSSFKNINFDKNQVKINPKDNKTIRVSVEILEKVDTQRTYIATIWIKDAGDAGVNVKQDLLVRIIEPKEAIKIDILTNKSFSPGKDGILSINFKNLLNRDLDNIKIKLTSDVYEEERIVRFLKFQSRTEDFVINLGPDVGAGDYKLSVRVFDKLELIGLKVLDINVLENPNIEERREPIDELLVRGIKVIKKNTGNLEVDEIFKYEISNLERLLTSTSPEYIKDCMEEGCKFELNPGDSIEIVVKIDYRWIAGIVLAIILVVLISYFVFKKDISIIKEVKKLKGGEEEVNELRVLLHVKNKSNRDIKNVMVYDYLPSMVKPTNQFGTLKPTKIQRGTRGIRLTWDLSELTKGEERVLSYIIEARLSIVGGLNLPSAVVRYNKGRKVVKVISSKLS